MLGDPETPGVAVSETGDRYKYTRRYGSERLISGGSYYGALQPLLDQAPADILEGKPRQP